MHMHTNTHTHAHNTHIHTYTHTHSHRHARKLDGKFSFQRNVFVYVRVFIEQETCTYIDID